MQFRVWGLVWHANPDEHVKMFRNIFTLPDIEEIFGE
jgi:hypothetical protein